MNLQAPEKAVRSDGHTLDVQSIFYTIQGEGPFAGTPAVFVRLAGCNLQCPLCDTEYTSGRKTMGVQEIVNAIRDLLPTPHAHRLIVITGGEPFRQNLWWLLDSLLNCMFRVQIETNGTLWPDWTQNVTWAMEDQRNGIHIVVSPKAGKVKEGIWRNAMCVKYVGDHTCLDPDDGLPKAALRHENSGGLARPPEWWTRKVYLQPTDFSLAIDEHPGEMFSNAELIASENQKAQQACVNSCMKYGHILQLQTHKIIGVP